MGDIEHRFTAEDGTEYKVAQSDAGHLQLCRWSRADRWFNGVALNCHGEVLLRELARLATAREAKGEQIPDGSREFEHGGKRWKIRLGPARLLELREGGGYMLAGLHTPAVPPLEVLAEQFAALGREQAVKATNVDRERDRVDCDKARATRDNAIGRSLLAEARLAIRNKEVRALRDVVAALEQQEHDSRAEVASLLEALDQQKARADRNDQAANDLGSRIPELVGEAAQWRKKFEAEKARADGLVKIGVAATEAMNEEWGLRKAAEERLAVLEGELVVAKTALAGRARTEGDPRRVVALASDDLGPLMLAADGSVWLVRRFAGQFGECERVPPLPPIEPEIKISAEGCGSIDTKDWPTS